MEKLETRIKIEFELYRKNTKVLCTKRFAEIFVKLEEIDGIDYETLKKVRTYCLSVWAYFLGGSGQCQDEIKNYLHCVKEKDKEKLLFILDIWNKYHSNNMKAGTKKQMDFIKSNEETKNLRIGIDYTKIKDILRNNDLLVDRRYEFGCGWLVEQIPQETLIKIRKLILTNNI